jgi:hypothetical protein
MNWGAIGGIGEFVGGIGVIVSFVYLAVQIRQNTHVQRRANLGDVATQLAAALRCVAEDSELSELALRGIANLGSLAPAERYRFDCFLYSWLLSFERALIDARDGEYPEESLIPMEAAIAGFLRTQGGRTWWGQRKVWFSAYGQESVERILDDAAIDHRAAGPLPEAGAS